MSKVPVLPPSGFRDFLPSEAASRITLIETITRTYLAHGFQPIGMSMVEGLETLQGKGGGTDNEKLIFKILKRGEELERAVAAGNKEFADLGLRFDLTLPLARYCARFREQLPKPFKVFQIGPVWRADRPQKGRYREFFQCDVDIIGAKEIGAEVDCISAIYGVFQKLEVEGVEIVLNDRRLLSALREKIGASPASWSKCLIILDKLDKMEVSKVEEQFFAELATGGVDIPNARIWLNRLLAGDQAEALLLELDPESFASLTEIKKLLDETLPGAKITISPTLIRGQDYYTGTIFELRHEKISGSLGGGGRYNRLLEIFGSPDTPAFGGSIGFERLDLLLQEAGKAKANSAPHFFLPLFAASLRGPVLSVASAMRARGIRVDVFPEAAKLKNQFKYADDRQIPFVAILGADEWQKKEIKIKDMAARTETAYSLERLSEFAEKMELLCRR
jgi:histidyl-tRNA synthetase